MAEGMEDEKSELKKFREGGETRGGAHGRLVHRCHRVPNGCTWAVHRHDRSWGGEGMVGRDSASSAQFKQVSGGETVRFELG